MRLCGYIRCSTEEQKQSGLGLDAQEELIQDFCQREGFDLIALHADPGVSGYLPLEKRKGMSQVLESLRSKTAEGVVFKNTSRLARNVLEQGHFLEIARKKHWSIIAIEGTPVDFDTSAGRFMGHVDAAVNQKYRDDISDWTRAAMRRLAKENKPRSRHAPYGFAKNGDGRLHPVPEEQAILARMLKLQGEGLGAYKIYKQIGKNPRTGRRWTPGAVWSVLETHKRIEEARR